jgi:hypothetical protein
MPTARISIHVLPPLRLTCLTEYRARNSRTDTMAEKEITAANATEIPTLVAYFAVLGFIDLALPPFPCRMRPLSAA